MTSTPTIASPRARLDGHDARLLLSPRVAVERLAADHVVVYHCDRGTRLRLSRPVFEMLARFAVPTAPDDVIAALGGREEVRRGIELLRARAFLIDSETAIFIDDQAGEPLVPARLTLFRCPAARSSEDPTDIVAVGAPSDAGMAARPGAREAPDVLRERSLDCEYRRRVPDGRPIGWFDVGRKRRVLEGVTMSDWGDVRVRPGEAPQRLHERIREVSRRVLAQRSFPLFLGGDHSVAYPIVEVVQEMAPVAVLYLDAHTDSDRLIHGTVPTASNVGRAVAGLPNVRRFVQLGHRGYTLSDKRVTGSDAHVVVTAADLRAEGPGALLRLLPPDCPVYASIDVCVLDPGLAPGTSSPCPDGLSPGEVVAVFRAVASERRIVGLDLCGFNPAVDPGVLTAKVLVHLLLGVLGAVHPCRS